MKLEEMTWKYNVADILRLRSGGPDMTVIRQLTAVRVYEGFYTEGIAYEVWWFDGTKLKKAEFFEAMLVPPPIEEQVED